MKKALNRWCLPSEMSIQSAIELCGSIGYDGLELNLDEEGELALDTPQERLLEICSWASEAGLELHSVSTPVLWRYHLFSSDQQLSDKAMTVVRKELEVAKALGASTVLVVVGKLSEGDHYDAVWERGIRALQELAEYAARLEVRIGVENVGNQFLLGPREMRDFVDAVGSAWVGAYYDAGNTILLRQGWPQQWIQILGERIFKVHVKDFVRVGKRWAVSTPLLAGDTINWPEVIAALRDVGYDDYLTLEMPPYEHYPTKLAHDAAESLDMLTGLTSGRGG